MLELAKVLHGLNRSGEDSLVQSVLGYRDSQMFLKDEFEAYGPVYAATEDGSFGTSGNVLDAIREQGLTADVIYACGPTPMLRALKAYAAEMGLECWLSLEEDGLRSRRLSGLRVPVQRGGRPLTGAQ